MLDQFSGGTPASPTPARVSPVTVFATPTSTAAAPTATPTPGIDATLAGQTRYIANTGGVGVRLRSECRDDSPGSGGWPEGATVAILYARASCAGWLYASRASQSSWVRAQYLSTTLPATATPVIARPVATSTPAPAPVQPGITSCMGDGHWIDQNDFAMYIRLEDGSVWEIGVDRVETLLWLPVQRITVIASSNSVYGYKLLNTDKGAVAKARYLGSGAYPACAAIESQIDGDFEGWDGDTIFKLRNGQIWQQSSYAYMYQYIYAPEVVVYRGAGGYRLFVKGVRRTIFVTRLR